MTDQLSEQVTKVPYPFVRSTYGEGDESAPCWVPGVRFEPVYPDDCRTVADGVGAVVYAVVGEFKPGKYPERVFYTRQWVDPDGKVFGKQKLLVSTRQKFDRLLAGFRFPYEASK